MNRRQKIVLSVTGIFIVLLILMGLTYAYFLTRITGSGNPTSISVTTANLELLYGDGTTSILTSETPLMPSSTPIGTKDFTVTNNGDDSSYVVVFEDIIVKYAANTVINGQPVAKDTPTTFESNDFVYTLTCIVKDKNGNTLNDKTCDGVKNEKFPMDGGIVVGNNIDKDDVHSYILTLYYLDNGLNQSADMNKTLNGKVNIKDIKSINPYSENTSSLAYNIINNSKLNKNGTELVATPPSKVAEEINLETEKVLSVTTDDYGNSYYYRGNVTDNYVTFAGMCWRIVRIQGDGSIKLILEDQDEVCSRTMNGNWDIPLSNEEGASITGQYGYKFYSVGELTASDGITTNSGNRYILDYLKEDVEDTDSMASAFKNFQISNLADYIEDLKIGEWCIADKVYSRSEISDSYTYQLLNDIEKNDYIVLGTQFYYDTNVRLNGDNIDGYLPTLKCNGIKMNKWNDKITNMYVGALTADEVVFAGGKFISNNNAYYIINEYQINENKTWWTISPQKFGPAHTRGYIVDTLGAMRTISLDFDMSFRPSVSLAVNTVIKEGVGTLEKPYIID